MRYEAILALGLLWLPVRGVAIERFRAEKAIALLCSAGEEERHQGFDDISSRLAAGALPAAGRRELITGLLAAARVEEPHYPLDSTPLLAIQLLAKLKAPEAVSVLLGRVTEQFPRFVVSDLSTLPPAAQALMAIGPPAIEPILDRSGAAGEEEWSVLRSILREMKEKDAVRAAVSRRLSAGASSVELARLNSLGR